MDSASGSGLTSLFMLVIGLRAFPGPMNTLSHSLSPEPWQATSFCSHHQFWEEAGFGCSLLHLGGQGEQTAHCSCHAVFPALHPRSCKPEQTLSPVTCFFFPSLLSFCFSTKHCIYPCVLQPTRNIPGFFPPVCVCLAAAGPTMPAEVVGTMKPS